MTTRTCISNGWRIAFPLATGLLLAGCDNNPLHEVSVDLVTWPEAMECGELSATEKIQVNITVKHDFPDNADRVEVFLYEQDVGEGVATTGEDLAARGQWLTEEGFEGDDYMGTIVFEPDKIKQKSFQIDGSVHCASCNRSKDRCDEFYVDGINVWVGLSDSPNEKVDIVSKDSVTGTLHMDYESDKDGVFEVYPLVNVLDANGKLVKGWWGDQVRTITCKCP